MWGCLAPYPHLSWGTKTTILLSVVLVGVKEKGLVGMVPRSLGSGEFPHTSANNWPLPRALTCLLQK